MVAGFTEDRDGNILPIHIERGGTREAERASERAQKSIQEGIVAYAQWYLKTHPIGSDDEGAVRREAQRVLFDLAFFPNEDQCSIGRQLIHSEPTSDDSALWLITDAKKGLGNWISGLRSPWKGGYLRSNGGRSAAAIYCAAEWLSAHLPLGSKAAMRRLLALMLMGR